MTTEIGAAPIDYGLGDYLSIVSRRWIWVLAAVIGFNAAVGLFSIVRPHTFEASSRVLLTDTAAQRALDPRAQTPGLISGQLPNEIALARSDVVEKLVRAELGLLPEIDLSADTEADILVFRATASSPADAALYANTWAEQYIAVKRSDAISDINAATANLRTQLEDLRRKRQALRAPLDELDDEILDAPNEREAAALQKQYDRLANDLSYELDQITSQADATTANMSDLELQAQLATVGEARIIQVAAPPTSGANAPLSLNLALGTVLGLIAGFVLAFLAERRDNTIKSAADVALVTDVAVLAGVPEAAEHDRRFLGIATYQGADGRFAEAYHKVRSALEFALFEREVRTILVTSPSSAEGKSTSASNLALAFASVGKRTVLIDVDFRRPRQHVIYGIDQAPGLSNVVLHNFDLFSVACPVQEPGLESLRVIPTGIIPPAPAAFVGTEAFRDAIGWIRDSSDLVILDAPPLLAVSDPHTLAHDVDAVVMTVRVGSTTRPQLREAIAALHQVGANIVGIVLVGVDRNENYVDYRPRDYRGDTGLHRALPAGGEQLWREPTGPVIELRFDRRRPAYDETRAG